MRFLLAAAMALLLSGCFGVPPGAAEFGDTVRIQYVAIDPDTREPLAWGLDNVPRTGANPEEYNGLALQSRIRAAFDGIPAQLEPYFVSGAGGVEPVPKAAFDQAIIDAGLAMELALNQELVLGDVGPLGFELERELVGAQVNQTLRVISRDDPTRDFHERVTADKWISDLQPLDQTIPRNTFEQNLGTPEMGQVFQFNNLFEAEVTAIDDNEVQARLLVQPDQEFDASVVGGQVVARVLGDDYRFELVLVPGEVFTIQSSPFSPAPLGLEDGTYRSVGTEGDEVVWQYASAIGALVGRDVEFVVKVLEITSPADEVLGDDYGARRSPVLAPGGAFGDDGHHHDDHGHDDHGHDDHGHDEHNH